MRSEGSIAGRAQGAHPRAILERLGHSSVSVSLDRYGHLFPGLDEALTEGLDERLRNARATLPRPTRAPGDRCRDSTRVDDPS